MKRISCLARPGGGDIGNTLDKSRVEFRGRPGEVGGAQPQWDNKAARSSDISVLSDDNATPKSIGDGGTGWKLRVLLLETQSNRRKEGFRLL